MKISGDWDADGSEAQVEMQTPRIWMQGRASQKRFTLLSRMWSQKSTEEDDPSVAFSLRFSVRTAGTRQAEGTWTAEAVMEVLKAIDEESSMIEVPS